MDVNDDTNASLLSFDFMFSISGFVQFIESVSVAEALASEGSIQNYFRKQAPAEGVPYGISQEVMDNYVKSCGKASIQHYLRPLLVTLCYCLFYT